MPSAPHLPLTRELSLLRDLRGPDRVAAERALRELSLAYYDTLLVFAVSYVHAVDIAEDVLQTVLIRMWEWREELDATRSIRPWLFVAVRNACVDRERRMQAAGRYEAQAPWWSDRSLGTPDAGLESAELDRAVGEAIAELPERCREIFVLSRTSGMSYAEIADSLGISVSTVKTQMGRAVRVLLEKAAPFLVGVFVLSR